MLNLIKFEFRKLYKSKYPYIIAIISLAFALISGLTNKALYDALIESGQPVAGSSAYLSTKGALAGTFTMLIGIFVALFATEDASSGTIKNIYARGYTRVQVYYSKYIVSLAASLLISIITVLFTFVYSNAIWGNDVEIVDNVAVIIIGQLLGIIAYHTIFFAISYVFEKVGTAIALNIVAPMIVSLVLGMGDALINSDNFKLNSYWIESLYGNFTSAQSDADMLGIGIALFVVYTIAALMIGMFISNKKEV